MKTIKYEHGKSAGAKEGKQSLICAINWLKNPNDGRTRMNKFFKKRDQLIHKQHRKEVQKLNEGGDKKEESDGRT